MKTKNTTADAAQYDATGEAVSDAIAMIHEAISETARHNTAHDFTEMQAALMKLSSEIEHYASGQI